MARTILTPVAVWQDFKIDKIPTATSLYEKRENNVIYTGLQIKGKKCKDGEVEIFAELAKTKSAKNASAIIIVKDFSGEQDEKLIESLAKKGFVVLTVDIGGVKEGKEYYTQYPQSLSYANYETVKDKLDKVTNGVKDTCWYEWVVTVRYALEFFRNMIGISNVGALGIGDAGTVVWQVAAMDKLDCATIVHDAGWRSYRGIYKFSGEREPQFSDNTYKFMAGIAPEAYASHVGCPVLMLSATNSKNFDLDRAYDTVNRLDDKIYRAVNYSVGYTDSVSMNAYESMLVFFNNYLRQDKKLYMPQGIEVKGEIINGSFSVTAIPDLKDLKEISLYVSEEINDPSLRSWYKIDGQVNSKKKEYLFEYKPYHESGAVTFFVTATYKSGLSICSNVQSKRYSAEEVDFAYKSKIIFSSRIPNSESVFFSTVKKDNVDTLNVNEVVMKKGPMGIEGVEVAQGIATFKMCTEKDRPNDDAILMFDVYVKEDAEVSVSLIADYFGQSIVYTATVNVVGGELWHNFKFNRAKFKTAEGMSLRNYQKIQAIAFNAQTDALINNALWV